MSLVTLETTKEPILRANMATETQHRLLKSVAEVAPQLPPLNRAIRLYIYYLIERRRYKEALRAINVALKRNPVCVAVLFERVEIFKSRWLLEKQRGPGSEKS